MYIGQTNFKQLAQNREKPVAADRLSTSDPHPLPAADDLLTDGWVAADEMTREALPGAMFMRQLGGGDSQFAPYDLTILFRSAGESPWIPVHGSHRMPGVTTPRDAAVALITYWNELPKDSKMMAVHEAPERPKE